MKSLPHHMFDRYLVGVALIFTVLIASCGSDRVSSQPNLRQEGRQVFSSRPGTDVASTNDTSPNSSIRSTGTWAIILLSFAGPDSQSAASARAVALATDLGRTDVTVRSTASGSAVVLGAYRTYDSPAAQQDLRWIRSQRIRGARPFGRAFLAPPRIVADPGRLPELSLGQARQSFGSRAKYTLQIGAYESPDADQAKRAAEKAALQLRQDGTLAFYHHGPRRSMVTVGIFNDDDLGANLQPSSPALIALMQAFPHNLLNGQGVLERRPGSERLQSSRLVLVPK